MQIPPWQPTVCHASGGGGQSITVAHIVPPPVLAEAEPLEAALLDVALELAPPPPTLPDEAPPPPAELAPVPPPDADEEVGVPPPEVDDGPAAPVSPVEVAPLLWPSQSSIPSTPAHAASSSAEDEARTR